MPFGLLLVSVTVLTLQTVVTAQTTPPRKPVERNKYQIDFKVDVDRLSYTGSERVKWFNRGEKPTSVIYFHLYPNLRVGEPDVAANSVGEEADEPRLDVVEVRSSPGDTPLYFFLDDQAYGLAHRQLVLARHVRVGHADAGRPRSNSSRTFRARTSGAKGFWRKATRGSSTPWCTMDSLG